MKMKHIVLIIAATIFSTPAISGTFVNDVCLRLNNVGNANSSIYRLGLTSMGSTHQQLNGIGQWVLAGAPALTPFAVLGSGEIMPNGGFIMSLNFTLQPDPAQPSVAGMNSISISLSAAGTGSFSAPFILLSGGLSSTAEAHGTAAIIPCAGIGI